MSHSKKLFQIASQLDKYTHYETSELDTVIEVAESVGESWSGSWRSFESNTYNRDFQLRYFGPYTGPPEKTRYSFDDVEQYINEKAGNPSIDQFSDDSKDATKAFKRVKSSALSFVYENFVTESDRFIQSWVDKIEELEICAESDFIEFHKSLNQQASKDQNSSEGKPNINMFRRRRSTLGIRAVTSQMDNLQASEENIEIPPHIAILAKVIATRQPFNSCKALNEQILKLAHHIQNIEETLLKGESGYQTDMENSTGSLEETSDQIETLGESPDRPPHTMGNDVFIVHGHDEAAKHAVARFVEGLGLNAIILDERVSRGQTIIEKLEQEASNADFAIVLLTPDDMGAPKDKLDKLDELKPRARQNVVLELGYFLRGLGRERVCVLHKEEVELPSDIHGIVYVPMDGYDGWQNKLRQEFEHAGLPVQNR